MSIGFYELLQVSPDAAFEAVRAAYQDQVAQVVRKQRAAEARQQDIAAIEARRASLAEAWAVVSDPVRRRRYDRFRQVTRDCVPASPEDLWTQADTSMVDPAAAAAVNVLRMLTDLRVGEAVFDAVPEEPTVSPVVHRGERTGAPAGRTESNGARPEGWDARPDPRDARDVSAPRAAESATPRAEPARSEPQQAVLAPPARPSTAAPAVVAPVEERQIPAENFARLLDHCGPTGAFLQAARELRGTSLLQLSTSTRISLRFLDAMEREAFSDLPGATFVRGYARMVVRGLHAIPPGVELDEFVESYMSRYFHARG